MIGARHVLFVVIVVHVNHGNEIKVRVRHLDQLDT